MMATSEPWPLPVAPSEPYSSQVTPAVLASRPSRSSACANRRAARIGPTVCELLGPMPILKRSKTLIAMGRSYAASRLDCRQRAHTWIDCVSLKSREWSRHDRSSAPRDPKSGQVSRPLPPYWDKIQPIKFVISFMSLVATTLCCSSVPSFCLTIGAFVRVSTSFASASGLPFHFSAIFLNEDAFLSLSIAWHFRQSLFLARDAAASALTAAPDAPEKASAATPTTDSVMSF